MQNAYRILLSFLLFLPVHVWAQQGVKGHIWDKREPVISAVVQVNRNGKNIGGTVTDLDGNYILQTPDTGLYQIIVSYPGYDSVLKEVDVHKDSFSILNLVINQKHSIWDDVAKCNIGRTSHRFVYGKVSDGNGRMLPGATILLFKNGKLNQTTVADDSAAYRFHCSDAGIVFPSFHIKSFYKSYDTTVIPIYFHEKEHEENVILRRVR